MQFVNIHGQPVDVTPKPEKKKSAPLQSQYHKGWRVVGFSPQQIDDGRLAYERDGLEAKTGRPFSFNEFMATHRPKAVRSKPYEVYEAALECRDLALHEGWIGVRVEQVAKGGGRNA